MKRARVFLSWVPSPSNDVINVHVLVQKNNEEVVVDKNVTPDVNELEVGVFAEGDLLRAVVTVSDGTYSTPAEVAVTIPDLTAPSAVEELGFTWEVIEEEVVE